MESNNSLRAMINLRSVGTANTIFAACCASSSFLWWPRWPDSASRPWRGFLLALQQPCHVRNVGLVAYNIKPSISKHQQQHVENEIEHSHDSHCFKLLASILTTLIYYIPMKLCIRKLVAEDVKDHDIACKIRKRMIEQGPRQLLWFHFWCKQ